MIRAAIVAIGVLVCATPAFAVSFGEDGEGAIEFSMPSGNVGCVYTPEGGTSTFQPQDGGPELRCDRVEPTYVRVILGPRGKTKSYNDVGDASCCGSGNIFSYGDVWKHDGYRCVSSESGLTCKRFGHGFSLSRKAVKTW
jgi:hypothetical protein